MAELKIKQLHKTYNGEVLAMDNISISIKSGMFGLLGPNGAGKSTLMRTIATLQKPDSGSIGFNNIDVLESPKEFRSHLGYLPQEFGVYPRITAEQLLNHIATLKGINNKNERKEFSKKDAYRFNCSFVKVWSWKECRSKIKTRNFWRKESN